MNPNFALDFRNDQIKLLHAQEGTWVQIGVVSVDDPDLDAALGYMRSTALGLSPRGIASKLILPDGAILFTTLSDLSSDGKTRATQIALALIGRTPYDVSDLVYDWTDDGPRAHLAVIARETLDEAETFANQHRFNPVAFAAWPEHGVFAAEADFGRSATASEMIAPLIAPEPRADTAVLSASDFEMGDAAKDIAAPEQSEHEPIDPNQFQVPLEQAFVPDDLDGDAINTNPILSEPTALQSLGAQDTVTVDPLADATGLGIAAFAVTPDLDHPRADAPDQRAEIAADDRRTDDQPAVQLNPTAPSADVQPDLFGASDGDRPSFADVMAEEAPIALDVPMDDLEVQEAPALPSPSAGKAQTLLAEFAARREAALGRAALSGSVEPALSFGKIALSPRDAPLDATPTLAIPSLVAPPLIASVVEPSIGVRAEPAQKTAPLTAQKPLRAPETALGSKPSIKRPAPKSSASKSVVMGFVLTILLLIALAAAAAMSSYLTAAWNSYGVTTSVASDQPSVADEVAADLPEGDVMTPTNAAPQTADIAGPGTLSNPVTLPVPTLASDSAISLVPLATPAALPQPIVVAPPDITTASAETPLAPLITPTAQGVMTPEGVFLIAGQPSVLPKSRPEAVLAVALQRQIGVTNLPNVAMSDPALAGKKPLLRPKTLAPKITSDPTLAGKRPLGRPETLLAAGNAAQIALASLTQPDPNAPRSALAVTISRLPVSRPKDLNTNIASVQDLTTPDLGAPDLVASETPLPNTPLEADNEPEVVASKSSGPRTVVSQSATYKNAINLSKVNLIGVYGSQANRYALIRQSNGRFKKVYVGDRFDGGMVAAITDNELRYSKGGQMLALQMPKG